MSENESAVPRSKPVKVVTRMTKEQKEILERYYNEGMKSKSKDSLVLQTAAAAECELPLHIVLNWIGNRQRQERQTFTKTIAKPRKQKLPPVKGVNAAAVSSAIDTAATTTTTANTTITTTDLVPHQLALLDTIAALGATSGRSSNSEGFVSPTAEEMPAVTVVNMNTNEEHIKGLMKQIQQLATQLNAYGVPTVALHYHDDCVYNSGSKEGQKFLKEHQVVQLAFHTYFQEQKEMDRLLRKNSLDKMRFLSSQQ